MAESKPSSISARTHELNATARRVRDLAHDAVRYIHGSQPEKGEEGNASRSDKEASLENMLVQITGYLREAEQDLLTLTKSINLSVENQSAGNTNR